MTHRSKLAGFIIDCKTDDLPRAADFWAEALGAHGDAKPADQLYIALAMKKDEPYIEVQAVDHESRVHLDIESDDIPAEVRRLQKLGAKKVTETKGWVVMEAPTGQRFCIVPVVSANFAENARVWNDDEK